MAQTTRSGPVFVVYAFQPSPSRVFHRSQSTYTIKVQLVLIKHEGIKKKLTKWPKRRVLHRLGPFSSSLPTPSRILSLRIYIYYKILVGIQKKQRKNKDTHLGPKRLVWRRLGSFLLSLPNPSCIQLLEPIYTIELLLVSKKKTKEN